MTAGTSQTDQAQTVKELKKWVQQQEETLRALYGEEVELTPSPLLLEEMEECFAETDWAAVQNVQVKYTSSMHLLGPQAWDTTLKAGMNFSGTSKITHINFLPNTAHHEEESELESLTQRHPPPPLALTPALHLS
ncbi:hypothetical protein CRENBAI_025406 [Crenichthys baileyi]|uniref:Uncharacterized protein n=1 Tax=Crenichthys baileyi TaxID=28760 RepID=A0AAV9SRK3_9TELE